MSSSSVLQFKSCRVVHKGWRDNRLPPGCFVGSCQGKIWKSQPCLLLDVVRPALALSSMFPSSLQSIFQNVFLENVMSGNVPKPAFIIWQKFLCVYKCLHKYTFNIVYMLPAQLCCFSIYSPLRLVHLSNGTQSHKHYPWKTWQHMIGATLASLQQHHYLCGTINFSNVLDIW